MSHFASQVQPAYLPGSISEQRQKSPAAIGIDFGGTNTKAVLIDVEGRVLREEAFPTPHESSAITDRILEAIISFDASGLPIGIGLPVLLDEDGVVLGAPNLTEVIGHNVKSSIIDALGELDKRPACITIENDSTCATIAEFYLGCAIGSRYTCVVVLGTGIGGGFIIDGKLAVGANRMAGEIGHMIIEPNGRKCPCGREGCWEMYASGDSLARLANERASLTSSGKLYELYQLTNNSIKGEDVVNACQAQDPQALAIMDEYAKWIALGIANLTTALDLELCVIAGGPASSGDVLLGPVRQHFESLMQYYSTRPKVTIALSAFEQLSGAIGAAWLALDNAMQQ